MIYERPIAEWGSLVLEARNGQRLTQRDLARRMGVTQGWLSTIENQRNPGALVSTIQHIAEGMDLEAWLRVENDTYRYSAPVSSVGRLMATMRHDIGLSQTELAKGFGYLTRGTIVSTETGKRSPRTARLERLFKTMGYRTYLQLREGATHVEH